MKTPALKVNQWLKEWEEVVFDKKARRAKPDPFFFLFTLPAKDLRALCGIYARSATDRSRGHDDTGIQRRHDEERSNEIQEFIRFGHPWAGLSNAKRKSAEYSDLKKPGWLPTAIVVNILRPGDERQGDKLLPADSISIETERGQCFVELPRMFSGSKWRSKSVPPIEVIDGQHRLWAFDEFDVDGKFDLPVVAFQGLDISWQAYLFYTINIKPKRINASLAFDLYPLLRTEDWLEKFEGAAIYRETRAQELVDLLYSTPQSPWKKQINMLGESGRGDMATQAAWVRALMATFIKSWEGKKVGIGGLFGAPVGSHELVLPWSRHEQAAFLIEVGRCFKQAVSGVRTGWAQSLRKVTPADGDSSHDPAFFGRYTLISQDQGIRGLLNMANDLTFLHADELKLEKWGDGGSPGDSDEQLISKALSSLRKRPVAAFIQDLTQELSDFDWRAYSAPGLTSDQSLLKSGFRGSGGYRTLRQQLLLHLSKVKGNVGKLAKQAIERLGYSD